MNPINCNDDWSGKTRLLVHVHWYIIGKDVVEVTNHSLVGIKACYIRNSWMVLLNGPKILDWLGHKL